MPSAGPVACATPRSGRRAALQFPFSRNVTRLLALTNTHEHRQRAWFVFRGRRKLLDWQVLSSSALPLGVSSHSADIVSCFVHEDKRTNLRLSRQGAGGGDAVLQCISEVCLHAYSACLCVFVSVYAGAWMRSMLVQMNGDSLNKMQSHLI